MNGYYGGVRSGDAGFTHPMQLLVQDEDGGSRGRVFQRGVQRFLGGEPGVPAVPNHFKCGRGCSGAPLGLAGGRGSGGSGQVG